jgi:hypothetical protein
MSVALIVIALAAVGVGVYFLVRKLTSKTVPSTTGTGGSGGGGTPPIRPVL